ncbi:MAG: hypothetical protein BGO09_10340 [Bacteroidetes bacterium 47-18]|nr:MAG: hypothetical protein BGO09_10340 [Bacteroidetes bacterium 47-18]
MSSAAYYLCCWYIARISSLFLLSAREFCKEITAQIAAGIHPINVTCKMRQSSPVSMRPRKKKDRNGKSIAINVISDISLQLVGVQK